METLAPELFAGVVVTVVLEVDRSDLGNGVDTVGFGDGGMVLPEEEQGIVFPLNSTSSARGVLS